MTVPARPKPKPDSATETARVLRIFDMLCEELASRFPPVGLVLRVDGNTVVNDRTVDILEIAAGIAARTEDPS